MPTPRLVGMAPKPPSCNSDPATPLLHWSGVDVDEEGDGFAAAGVFDAVGDVGGVVGAVAFAELAALLARGDADRAFFDGEEFSCSFKVGGAGQFAARLEGQFVKLDVLL